MSGVTRPRGPLPSRVYWTRRVVALLVVIAVVWGVGRLAGGAVPAASQPSAGDTAAPVRAVPTDASDGGMASPATTPTGDTTPGAPSTPTSPSSRPDAPADRPAAPQGTCADSDVLVTPLVREAHVGRPIDIVLRFTTVEAEACSWEVRPESVVLRITQDGDPVWSSQHCPSVVPIEMLVPRRTRPDRVVVTWDGKYSDPGCTTATDWAYPGEYAVAAVARGSVTPVETAFTLGEAVGATVTAIPTPSPTPAPTPAPDEGATGGEPDGQSEQQEPAEEGRTR